MIQERVKKQTQKTIPVSFLFFITGTTVGLQLQSSKTLHLKQRRVSNIIESQYTVV